MDDREMLIRVEQQMIDAARNQSAIMSDLKELFNRIESESKITTQLKGDLKTYIETSTFRIVDIDRRLTDATEALRDLQDDLKQEKEDRNKFQNQVEGSLKTIKWIFGIAAFMATVLTILQFALPHLK